MFRRRAKPGLSRKIVAYYLFFCLVAVCWLAAGTVFTCRAVVDSRRTDFCLTRIGSAGAALEMQLLRGPSANTTASLVELRGECHALWCGIVGRDGKYIDHTQPDQVGRTARGIHWRPRPIGAK